MASGKRQQLEVPPVQEAPAGPLVEGSRPEVAGRSEVCGDTGGSPSHELQRAVMKDALEGFKREVVELHSSGENFEEVQQSYRLPVRVLEEMGAVGAIELQARKMRMALRFYSRAKRRKLEF